MAATGYVSVMIKYQVRALNSQRAIIVGNSTVKLSLWEEEWQKRTQRAGGMYE